MTAKLADSGAAVANHHSDGDLPTTLNKEAKMIWIMLLWPSIVAVLILLSALAWQDTLKIESSVRRPIDDIPFRSNPYRHSDGDRRR